jgi:hypothetical protein
MSSMEKMISDLHAALGSLAPAVVTDSLRYVSARPLAKATAQDHVHLLVTLPPHIIALPPSPSPPRHLLPLDLKFSYIFICADQGGQRNRSRGTQSLVVLFCFTTRCTLSRT